MQWAGFRKWSKWCSYLNQPHPNSATIKQMVQYHLLKGIARSLLLQPFFIISLNSTEMNCLVHTNIRSYQVKVLWATGIWSLPVGGNGPRLRNQTSILLLHYFILVFNQGLNPDQCLLSWQTDLLFPWPLQHFVVWWGRPYFVNVTKLFYLLDCVKINLVAPKFFLWGQAPRPF